MTGVLCIVLGALLMTAGFLMIPVFPANLPLTLAGGLLLGYGLCELGVS